MSDPVADAIMANLVRCDTHRAGPLILGIDPGLSGALAIVDPETLALWRYADMPVIEASSGRRQVSAPELARLLMSWRSLSEATGRRLSAIVEEVSAMPGQGVSSMFGFGRSFGVLLGSLAALDIPVELVRPAVWKKAARVPRDKAAARRIAQERFPEQSDLFARVRDDGRAEAVLLARWRASAAQ